MQMQPSAGNLSTGTSSLPGESASDIIVSSHERSRAFGLRAHESADVRPLSADALAHAIARNEALCAHALPVMETLHSQIAGTQSMVLLTDAQGVILHALGDDDFLGRAQRVALRPGVAWSEQSKGTNAIGTALATGAAVQINGEQHYLASNHFLTCSCVPIADPQGQFIGALDVSGDWRGHSAHTLALVRMSAQMVENHLFDRVYADAVRLRFHARSEFLGTLMEGMAAFSADGRFLSANRSGQFQFGLSLAGLRAHTFSSLFGPDMASLLAHARSHPGGRLSLNLPGGVRVAAIVEWAAAARQVTGWAAPMAEDAIAPRAAPGLSGLRYLSTGDPQLAQAIERVRKVMGRDVTTMILGETGTGKELLARAIHQDSPRRRAPFVAVNCASVPETLIESELFGYDEGAFTGARRRGAAGKIVQAQGGTLFLDEIGDMPLSMQARLLRVLQERSVAPLGSTRQVSVDVAVVCATHRNLREMMAAGQFREDLYYRLNGLVVRLPPLRERTDLEVIIDRVLRAQGAAPGLAIADDVLALLRGHAWPGNLRQLTTVLQTAMLMAEGEPRIERCHLPEDFLDEVAWAADEGAGAGAPASAPASTRLHDAALQLVQQTLAEHGGNVSAAARALGVSRNTVYRQLRAVQR